MVAVLYCLRNDKSVHVQYRYDPPSPKFSFLFLKQDLMSWLQLIIG